MEKQKSQSTQLLIILGAFSVALAFRLIRLGLLPLNNTEAEIALQALTVARGGPTLFGDQMAYVGLTGIAFHLFSPGNFLARFWPALVGTSIVFIPFLFRKIIGEWPAVIASILLAISPEVVGLSRMIGTPLMAMAFLLLALGFWSLGKPILFGVCMALGLMSGSGFWIGVLILGVSLAISEWLFKVRDVFLFYDIEKPSAFWTRSAISFAVALLIVGTGFFMAPRGLSGTFSGLYTFILGFGEAYHQPIGMIPFALLAYGTGAVIFGLWGGIRGILVKSRLDMFLFTWAVFGLAFLMLYPGGGPANLIWVSVPLWLLSARVVYFAWGMVGHSRLVLMITAALVVVVSAFMVYIMRTLVTPTLTQEQQLNYLIAFVGGMVLVVAIILLVGYGWSQEIAKAGLLLGLALVFSAGMIATSVNSTSLGPEVPYELWYPDEAVITTEWLQVAIDRVIVWNARRAAPVDLAVADFDTPGMRWALRHYSPLDFVPFIPAQATPGILITGAGVIPEIAYSYQGQGLIWSRVVPWADMSPNEFLTWLIAHKAPTIPQEIILWVRTDLMPGGQ